MDLFFWTFYRYATQGVASEARRGPLIVPQMVLEYSHRAATFRDFRGEAISVAKRAAVPALHVPILRCRIKAFGVVPSQPATSLWTAVLPTDRRQLKTCDSRADEI